MEEQQKQTLRNALDYCIEHFEKGQAVERIIEYVDDSLKLKESELKLLTIPVVNNQRELLLAFANHLFEVHDIEVEKKIVDDYLNSK